MPVTTEQIARELGLSRRVVDKVLIGGQSNVRVSAQTRERVTTAARRLNYRPNAAARSIATGRFGTIALLLGTDSYHSTLAQDLLHGLGEALDRRDLNLMLLRVPDERLAEPAFVPRMLREACADGTLIAYTHAIPPRLIELAQQHQLPSVWINSQHPTDAIYPDDLAAGRRATEYLLALGHRRILYAGPSPDRSPHEHYSVTDRLAGYRQAMRDAALPTLEQLVDRDSTPASFADDIRATLRAEHRPTAAVCYGVPLQVVTCALEAGLRIPDDLSVLTFGGGGAIVGRRLTALAIPLAEVGAGAVEMLCQKIENANQPLPNRVVPFGEPSGETCAPPAPSP